MERQMDIPTLLLQTLSPIKQVREDAETQLRAVLLSPPLLNHSLQN